MKLFAAKILRLARRKTCLLGKTIPAGRICGRYPAQRARGAGYREKIGSPSWHRLRLRSNQLAEFVAGIQPRSGRAALDTKSLARHRLQRHRLEPKSVHAPRINPWRFLPTPRRAVPLIQIRPADTGVAGPDRPVVQLHAALLDEPARLALRRGHAERHDTSMIGHRLLLRVNVGSPSAAPPAKALAAVSPPRAAALSPWHSRVASVARIFFASLISAPSSSPVARFPPAAYR